jgi:hypothetical protein
MTVNPHDFSTPGSLLSPPVAGFDGRVDTLELRPRGRWRRVVLSALGVLVGLAALDLATGTVYRTSTAASLHVTAARTGSIGRALVVFPGFAMPGDLLGEAFAPYLPADDAMIVVRYAERGVDVAAISSAVEAELSRLAPREVVVYGASMGGMVARRAGALGRPVGRHARADQPGRVHRGLRTAARR